MTDEPTNNRPPRSSGEVRAQRAVMALWTLVVGGVLVGLEIIGGVLLLALSDKADFSLRNMAWALLGSAGTLISVLLASKPKGGDTS